MCQKFHSWASPSPEEAPLLSRWQMSQPEKAVGRCVARLPCLGCRSLLVLDVALTDPGPTALCALPYRQWVTFVAESFPPLSDLFVDRCLADVVCLAIARCAAGYLGLAETWSACLVFSLCLERRSSLVSHRVCSRFFPAVCFSHGHDVRTRHSLSGAAVATRCRSPSSSDRASCLRRLWRSDRDIRAHGNEEGMCALALQSWCTVVTASDR